MSKHIVALRFQAYWGYIKACVYVPKNIILFNITIFLIFALRRDTTKPRIKLFKFFLFIFLFCQYVR